MKLHKWLTSTIGTVIAGATVAIVAGTMAIGGVAQAAPRENPAVTMTSDPVVRAQMADQLRRAPAGKMTGPSQITYDNGKFVVDFAPDAGSTARLGTPNCPTNWVCFYDGTNYGYPRGKLQDCGQQDLATWGWRNRTNSAHDHHGASADFWDVESDFDGFWVDSGQAIADVGSAKNKVDLIYINCG